MGRVAEVAGALLSVAAGIYLLARSGLPTTVGGQPGQSWLEVIAHGIGAYFIARGLWMIGHVGQDHARVRALDRLVELAEDNENRPASPSQ